VEVLHGKDTSASGHARRAGDTVGDARRALDWGSRASDILLFPHSPLALADVLSHPSGRFDLKPVPPASSAEASELSRENALAAETGGDAPIVSLQQRRRRRHPRERVNLLTRHGEQELLERCRRLLVENALVKNRGERQLFLAAGFLSWQDGDDAESRVRAPLLFYPVLLVKRADEPCYELRLDGSVPLGNPGLADIVHERHAIRLQRPDPDTPLADQLAQVAALVAESEALSLDFDIALGNADLPQPIAPPEPVRLPPAPTEFDIGLATELVAGHSLTELDAVLHLLPDYASDAGLPVSGKRADAEPEDASPDAGGAPATLDIARLREYAARLAAEGLEGVEFRHLGELPASLARWRETVSVALGTTSVNGLVGDGDIGTRHLVRLAGIIELVDKAPAGIEHHAHPDLCFHATTGVLRRARHQARLIEDELTALKDWFVLDKVPAKRQLLSLIEELGGSVGIEPDIIDADYFNARRQFMEFSIEKPANLTPEHRRLLGQLAKVLRFRELFVNNTEYRAALGPGYRGLRTEWATLEGMSAYAVELADVLESETLAAAALSDWSAFRRAFVAELEVLQRAADATRRLVRIGGSRWRSRPVVELLAHTVALGERLTAWHAEYGPVESHARRTAASLLARFSGDERDDLLTEARVAESRQRIDSRLAAGTTTVARVLETLAWLRAATDIAVEHALDVEVIVAELPGD